MGSYAYTSTSAFLRPVFHASSTSNCTSVVFQVQNAMLASFLKCFTTTKQRLSGPNNFQSAACPKKSQSQDGRCAFLLPQVLEQVARDEPTRIWFTIPNSPDLETGWRDITFAELNHAVNGFAKWIERSIGVGNGQGVMAYVGYEPTNAFRLSLTP
jgi:hypothetical protein